MELALALEMQFLTKLLRRKLRTVLCSLEASSFLRDVELFPLFEQLKNSSVKFVKMNTLCRKL
jgi:hypothetical protein